MKVLFKALRNSKDLTSVLNFCENNGIETLKLENIRFDGNTGIINWGGYAAAPPIGVVVFRLGKIYLTILNLIILADLLREVKPSHM